MLNEHRTITLIPVAMIVPTSECIYAPSRIERPITIPYRQFLTDYANHTHSILVSFEHDGESNPQIVTGYGIAFNCWYIIDR